MKVSHTRTSLLLFGVLGLAASAAATWVHYHLIVQPGYSAFCDINATVSCAQAYLSSYGSIGGVPVAVGGIIFFTIVLLLLWAGRSGHAAAVSAPTYIFALSTVGLAVVLYLAYASFFVLKEVCPICVATYIAVAGLFVVSGRASTLPISQLPRRAPVDLRALAGAPLALTITVVLIGASVAAVELFPRARGTETVAAAPAPELRQDQQSEFARWWEMQERVEMPFPRNGARVLIVKFSDYQCPACKRTHYAYGPVIAKYRPEEVAFVLKQYPLNPACNAAVHTLIHTAACESAAAGMMARRRGTLDALTDWFFANQEAMSPASVKRAAREVGHIDDFEGQFPAAIQEVKAEAAAGAALKVEWTPTFFINGRRLPREGLTPQYFEAAIELELKRPR